MLSSATCLNSCSLINPDSPVPSYVHIDSITVATNYPVQGSNSKKISEAWVIYDEHFLGVYPLPADIPLPDQGEHSFEIKGGIIENGIGALRSAYPLYTPLDTVINLKAFEKITVNPVVTYSPSAVFPQIEDFDDASLSLVSTSIGVAPLIITNLGDPNAFENNSGKTTLDDSHPVFEVASSTPFQLPLYTPSYLEMNYKCMSDFAVGLFVTTSTQIYQTELLSLRATAQWNKVYISLTDLGGVTPDAIDYKIYIRALKNSTLSTSDLYFDNLKVVY